MDALHALEIPEILMKQWDQLSLKMVHTMYLLIISGYLDAPCWIFESDQAVDFI